MKNLKYIHFIFIVVTTTFDSILKIPVGNDPHEIVTNQRGTLAYISKPLMNDSVHEIAVVNIKTMQFEKMIDTNPLYFPHGLIFIDIKILNINANQVFDLSYSKG